IEKALSNMRQDPKGQWILSPHRDAYSEYALSTVQNGQAKKYIIDRTFIDENGTRWIIDFKTNQGDVEKEKARYQDQLETYARLMQKISKAPIRLALYFPMLPAWIEWIYT
ncbi:MAG: PD-(D/E)XK nuclease family protein, partial [Gammaproteobacteria bacterium]|nr:PD-(D/E)XK nuclease family protein [Gammaproteobacteria bacterium]MBU1927248.1 PD-(D/E)XK nuclease family protein [Gammaproteobacteria bacterium]